MAHLESTAMTRSTRATLLMIALLWQSLVWLTPLGQAQLSTDITNAWVHAQAQPHRADHHHDTVAGVACFNNACSTTHDPLRICNAGSAEFLDDRWHPACTHSLEARCAMLRAVGSHWSIHRRSSQTNANPLRSHPRLQSHAGT